MLEVDSKIKVCCLKHFLLGLLPPRPAEGALKWEHTVTPVFLSFNLNFESSFFLLFRVWGVFRLKLRVVFSFKNTLELWFSFKNTKNTDSYSLKLKWRRVYGTDLTMFTLTLQKRTRITFQHQSIFLSCADLFVFGWFCFLSFLLPFFLPIGLGFGRQKLLTAALSSVAFTAGRAGLLTVLAQMQRKGVMFLWSSYVCLS